MTYEQLHLDHDGQRLGVHVYPDPGPDAPVVLFLPAMGVPARYYEPWAAELAARGLFVVIPDLRGIGGSSPRAARASRHGVAELVADVSVVLDEFGALFAGRKMLLAGHSLGGQLAALHLATRSPALVGAGGPPGPEIRGLLLLATGLPYYRVYKRRKLGVLAFSQGIHAGASLIGYWPGWLFAGRQSRGVIRDWAYTARNGRFPALGGADAEAGLGRVDLPVLAISLAGDQFTPSPTLDHLLGKLKSATIVREHHRPEGRTDHFTWVRSSGPLAERVSGFVATL